MLTPAVLGLSLSREGGDAFANLASVAGPSSIPAGPRREGRIIMAERKTIRLHSPVRSGHLIVPENAVVDAAPEIADELVGEGHAEYTDALERYPNLPVLDVLNDY